VALLVATRGDPLQGCKAAVIGRALWRQRGALAVRRQGADFVIQSARTKNFDRPWSPARVARAAVPAGTGEAGTEGAMPRVLRDATPRQEDIEADQ
jgi:hypothetical protein